MSKRFIACVLLLLHLGCTDSQPKDPLDPWERAEALLKSVMSSGSDRPEGIEPSPWKDVQVLRDASSRVGPLKVIQLTRSQDDRRLVQVSTTFGGWPTTFEVGLQIRDNIWTLSHVHDLTNIRNQLNLTGAEGLPRVKDGEPWLGGLSGFDTAGRPNTAVLVHVGEDDVRVDGQSIQERSEKGVRDAIRSAFAARASLLNEVKATYQPHIAIAAPRNAQYGEIADIVRWAGAEGSALSQLLVQTDNGPGWLPLGHIRQVPGSVPIRRHLSARGSNVNIMDLESGQTRSITLSELSESMSKPERGTDVHDQGRSAMQLLLSRSNQYEYFIKMLSGVLTSNPNLVIVTEVLE